MQNWQQTLISQYANSSRLTALLDAFNSALDPSVDIDNFYQFVWNIETAAGFGLDIWGRIVGLPTGRSIKVPSGISYMGFYDSTGDWKPFNQAPFYTASSPLDSTATYMLTDDAFRTLILVKALANISDCSISNINNLLSILFAGRGRCYVLDTGSMTLNYVFEFALLPYEYTILTQSGYLLRPSGVGVNITVWSGPPFEFFETTEGTAFGDGVFVL